MAERDARYTEDQIRALSADYTIGLHNAGNVQMKFNLFESADLQTFAPLTVNPDSVSVVDGSICLELAPADRVAFFRFSVEEIPYPAPSHLSTRAPHRDSCTGMGVQLFLLLTAFPNCAPIICGHWSVRNSDRLVRVQLFKS